MKRSAHGTLTFLGALAAAAVGFGLRLWQLNSGKNDLGLWDAGSAPVLTLPLVSLLLIAGAVFMARRLPKAPEAIPGGLDMGIGGICGGVLLTASGALTLLQVYGLARAAALVCVLAGIVTVIRAMQCIRGAKPALLTGCIIVLWLVLRIIGDFKTWSTDPAVQDYCYPLFALLCSMAACFHMAGWLGGLGRGRLTAFWSLTGVFFCGVALAEGSLLNWLVYLALLCINAQNLRCLLKAK